MSDPRTDTYREHVVPEVVGEQAFRAEMLRTTRLVLARVEKIDARLHEGDLKMQAHAQSLTEQTRRLEDHEREHAKSIEDLDKRLFDMEAKRQEQALAHTVLATRFAVVWAGIALVCAAAVTALVRTFADHK